LRQRQKKEVSLRNLSNPGQCIGVVIAYLHALIKKWLQQPALLLILYAFSYAGPVPGKPVSLPVRAWNAAASGAAGEKAYFFKKKGRKNYGGR
jgi:hypothetical protein